MKERISFRPRNLFIKKKKKEEEEVKIRRKENSDCFLRKSASPFEFNANFWQSKIVKEEGLSLIIYE